MVKESTSGTAVLMFNSTLPGGGSEEAGTSRLLCEKTKQGDGMYVPNFNDAVWRQTNPGGGEGGGRLDVTRMLERIINTVSV